MAQRIRRRTCDQQKGGEGGRGRKGKESEWELEWKATGRGEEGRRENKNGGRGRRKKEWGW